MGSVHEALDEAKLKIQKLEANYQSKCELFENLKRSHNELLTKNQEANSKLEKLTQELTGKEDDLAVTKQLYVEIESKLKEKATAFKHLISTNDKLRADYAEMVQKCKEENRGLALALDGATATNLDQEKQLTSLKQEIEGLREFVSASQKQRSSGTEKRAKEVRHNDDMFSEIEEENRKLADKMKWNKEQFGHLEEAHAKLKQQYQNDQKEWEKERSKLLDEISTMQMDLDSQLRVSKDLESRLRMCNQALAHEESRRKLLEVQLIECKTSFDSVCTEYEESKSAIESLTSQRDKEVANLRDMLGSRDARHKEMEYQFRKLEQENQELMASVKELQEAKIQEASGASSSSLSKFRNKLTYLKSKEAEWVYKLEQLTGELDCCKSSLRSKDTLITELQGELETCESLTLQLTLQNEETSMMLLVLKSQFSELHRRIADDYNASLEREKREGVENICTLIEQLHTKNEYLVRVEKDLEEERENVALLSEKVESLNSKEQQQIPLQREVDMLKKMLRKASASQIHLKEEVLCTKSELEQVRDALDRANEELAESFSEGNELEFELQVWKSVAEKMKSNLDENYQMRRQVEESLLEQADVEFDLKQERESLELKLSEKDKRLNELEKEVEYLEQEWVRKELEGAILAQVEAERKHNTEKESLQQLVKSFVELSESINLLSEEDMRLAESMERIVQNCDMKQAHELFDPAKENNGGCPSTPTKRVVAANLDERSPLRSLNN